jgi:hypothetical protein
MSTFYAFAINSMIACSAIIVYFSVLYILACSPTVNGPLKTTTGSTQADGLLLPLKTTNALSGKPVLRVSPMTAAKKKLDSREAAFILVCIL